MTPGESSFVQEWLARAATQHPGDKQLEFIKTATTVNSLDEAKLLRSLLELAASAVPEVEHVQN